MPQPLSVTRIYVTPPRRISTVTIEAPASIEFSTSSLMTEEGRSTTSPAAISSATCLSSTLIFGIFCTCLSFILSEYKWLRQFLSIFASSKSRFIDSIGVSVLTSTDLRRLSTSVSFVSIVS